MTQSHQNLNEAFQADGRRASPVLARHLKNYLVDIDGTICEDVPNEEPERMGIVEPFPLAVETLNAWYDQGHVIYFFTSRTEAHRLVTEEWLQRHGFKYHGILFGKPRGGNYHWIDNHPVRTTLFEGNFPDMLRKMKESEGRAE